MDRGLASRVATADDHHVAAAHGLSLGSGGSVEHPGSNKCLEARNVKAAPGYARREYDGACCNGAAVARMDDPVIAPQLKLRPALSQHDVGPEEPSLFAGAPASSSPLTPCRKPR